MSHKLIKDIDEKLWNKFVALAKIKGVRVNKELEQLLKAHLNKELSKLFKK